MDIAVDSRVIFMLPMRPIIAFRSLTAMVHSSLNGVLTVSDDGHLYSPQGIAVDSSGNVYVTDKEQ